MYGQSIRYASRIHYSKLSSGGFVVKIHSISVSRRNCHMFVKKAIYIRRPTTPIFLQSVSWHLLIRQLTNNKQIFA